MKLFGDSPAINPARDIGPRIFLWLLHWGNSVFSDDCYYFWIPLIMPFIGSLLGLTFYHSTLQKSIQKTLKFDREAQLLFGTMSQTQPTVNYTNFINPDYKTNIYGAQNGNSTKSAIIVSSPEPIGDEKTSNLDINISKRGGGVTRVSETETPNANGEIKTTLSAHHLRKHNRQTKRKNKKSKKTRNSTNDYDESHNQDSKLDTLLAAIA